MTDQLTISAVGVVGTDPRHVHTAEGLHVTSFRLGVTEQRFDKAQNKYVDLPTSWMTVTAFRQLGAHVAETVRKKDRVVVRGRLAIKEWKDDQGRSGTSAELVADAVGQDLLFGTTVFTPSGARTAAAPQSSAPQPSAPAAQSGDWGAAVPVGAEADLPF